MSILGVLSLFLGLSDKEVKETGLEAYNEISE